MIRVGVLGVQGAVSEHLDAVRRAAAAAGIEAEATAVLSPEDLAAVDGIILPGGESTTISRLLRSEGLQTPLLARARAGDLAVFGTCAGMILLASDATHDVEDKDIELLALIDATVDRNAFGRQKESFEAVLEVDGIGRMPAVFIRAPAYDRLEAPAVALARTGDRIVAAESGHVLAAAFHPELTPDTRLHERFLAMVQAVATSRSP